MRVLESAWVGLTSMDALGFAGEHAPTYNYESKKRCIFLNQGARDRGTVIWILQMTWMIGLVVRGLSWTVGVRGHVMDMKVRRIQI